MWLWRFTSPKNCSWQAADLGEPQYCSSWKPSGLKTQEELMFQFKSEGRKKTDAFTQRQSGRRKFLILAGGSVFCFIQSFNQLDGPTHINEGNQLYSVYYSNVNLIQNALTDILGDQRPRHPVQWKYKINYCTR